MEGISEWLCVVKKRANFCQIHFWPKICQKNGKRRQRSFRKMKRLKEASKVTFFGNASFCCGSCNLRFDIFTEIEASAL